MDKDKLKKIIIIGVIIIVVIVLIISGVFYFKHISSTNFKLKKIGYTDQEITVINENSDIVDLALTEYNKNLVPLLSSKYFMRNRSLTRSMLPGSRNTMSGSHAMICSRSTSKPSLPM